MRIIIIILLTSVFSCTKGQIIRQANYNPNHSLIALASANIIADGNSYAVGYPSFISFPSVIRDSLLPFKTNGSTMQNFGVTSQTTEMMLADERTQVLTQYDCSKQNILLFQEGGNDIYNFSNAALAVANVAKYCDSAKAVGFRIIVSTLIHRYQTMLAGGTIAAYNAKIDSFNLLILAQVGVYDDIIRPDLDTIFLNYNTSAKLSSGYYDDGIHPNQTGQSRYGRLYATAIISLPPITPQCIIATGGTITTDGNYKVHTFNSSGTFQITSGSGKLVYLIVGGGAGGGVGGGGGGAGGMTTDSAYFFTSSNTVTVGNGGAVHTRGDTSVFNLKKAAGGGFGAGNPPASDNGGNGGSGGGASCSGAVLNGGNGTAGQGFAGGHNGTVSPFTGGGGGGASAVGGNGTSTVGGAGGAGLASSITGSSVTYAGGGGGGVYLAGGTAGTGGAGGGGAGNVTTGVATAGTANLGGGGGGTGNGGTAGVGGKGVIIIRYRFQ